MFLYIIKKINGCIASNFIDKSNPNFKEILLTNLEHSHLYHISKANFFNLFNFYLLDKAITKIENKKVKDYYIKYKEENVSKVDYDSYLEYDKQTNKTLNFFENEGEGFFVLLKSLLSGEILDEKLFFAKLITLTSKYSDIIFFEQKKKNISFKTSEKSHEIFNLDSLFSHCADAAKYQINFNCLAKILSSNTEKDHYKELNSFFDYDSVSEFEKRGEVLTKGLKLRSLWGKW